MSWHQACESSPMELLTIRLSGGDCMDTLTWSSRRFSVLGIVMLALPVLVLPTVAGGEETRAGVVTKLVIAEVEPVVGGYRSTITILKGHVDVTKLDGAGRLTGAAVDVRMLERVIVTNAKPLAAAEKITRRDAESLAAQFSFVPQTGP